MNQNNILNKLKLVSKQEFETFCGGGHFKNNWDHWETDLERKIINLTRCTFPTPDSEVVTRAIMEDIREGGKGEAAACGHQGSP